LRLLIIYAPFNSRYCVVCEGSFSGYFFLVSFGRKIENGNGIPLCKQDLTTTDCKWSQTVFGSGV